MIKKYFTKENILKQFNTVNVITTLVLLIVTISLRESGLIEYILKIFYSDVSDALCWFISLSLAAIVRLLIKGVIQAMALDLSKYFGVMIGNLIKYFKFIIENLIHYYKSILENLINYFKYKKLSKSNRKMINIIFYLSFVIYFLYFYLRLFF